MSEEQKTEVTPSKQGRNIQHSLVESMSNLFDDMEHRFENALPRRWRRRFRGGRQSWDEQPVFMGGGMPSVDVIDRDHEVLVRAEIPGVDKEDLDVSVTEDSVTIKGRVQHEEEEEEGEYYRREISCGAFARTVVLPSAVDTDKVKAKFKDGFLKITMSKLESSKRQKVSVE